MILNKQFELIQKIFDAVNEYKFEGKLPDPVFVSIEGGGKKYGHCTNEKMWINEKGDEAYEIAIATEWLQEINFYELVDTVIHECVHMANRSNGIVDCKRKRHNEDFKNLAESVGLVVEKTRGGGWNQTKLSEELIQWIEEQKFDTSVLDWYRKIPEPKPKVKRKKRQLTYVCPECKIEIKSKVELSCIHEECGCQFELKEEDE